MKKYFLLLVVYVFSGVVQAAKTNITIQHWTLKNGTGVYFVRRTEVPMLDVSLVFNAGSVFDGKHFGLASLTGAMIGEGAKHLSGSKIAERFENVGAHFDVNTTRDMTIATLRTITSPNQFQQAIATFKHVITKPTFPVKAIKRIKKQLMTAIKLQQENPWSVAKNVLYRTIYKNFSYAHDPLGTSKSIQSVSRVQLKKFYRRYYTGLNTKLVLVGNLSNKQAKTIANKIAGALPTGKLEKQKKFFSKPQMQYVHKHMPVSQTTIMLGQQGILPQSKDYYPLMIGNAILGGLPLSSLLYTEVREKRGLAYFATSHFNTLKYRGLFSIALQTKMQSAKLALSIAKDTLEKFVKDGPTQKQLSVAKKNLIGRFPLAISSNDKIMQVLVKIAFYQLPLDYLDLYRQKISAVSLDDVKQSLQKIVHPKHLVIVTVGPKKVR